MSWCVGLQRTPCTCFIYDWLRMSCLLPNLAILHLVLKTHNHLLISCMTYTTTVFRLMQQWWTNVDLESSPSKPLRVLWRKQAPHSGKLPNNNLSDTWSNQLNTSQYQLYGFEMDWNIESIFFKSIYCIYWFPQICSGTLWGQVRRRLHLCQSEHRRICGTARHRTVPSNEDVENRPSLSGPRSWMVMNGYEWVQCVTQIVIIVSHHTHTHTQIYLNTLKTILKTNGRVQQSLATWTWFDLIQCD